MNELPFEFIDPMKLSRNRIIQIAECISHAYVHLHGRFPAKFFTINFDHVYDTLIYPKYGVSLSSRHELGVNGEEKVLGYYDVYTNTIAIDAALSNAHGVLHSKRVFTCWHELGHAFLHSQWMRAQIRRFPDGRTVTLESSISLATSEKLEQQANLFAAYASVPRWFLDYVVRSTFRLDHPIYFRGSGEYWLDVWRRRKMCRCNSFHDLCMNIAYNIQHRFGGLSIEALIYRIQDSAFVKDDSHNTSQPFTLLRTAPVQIGNLAASS